jgi:predicted dehydrogenase
VVEDRKLGVAIHGAGWVAHAHAASWKKNPFVRIVSVTDIDRDRAERFAAELGLDCRVGDRFEDVLRDGDVDIVDVTGPSHVHAEQGIAAAEAGKHVLVEKPIALSMTENRALRDAVAKAGVKSLGGFVGRWNPSIANLKSLLAAGTIGELIYAEADYWHGMGPSHHAWNLHSKRKTGGSAMLLAGCHAIDALRWLTGDEVVEVTAIANNKRGNFEYDPNVVAVMKFQSGMLGKASTLFDCAMPYTFNIDLIGLEGTLRDNRLWSKKLLPGQTGWAVLPTILLDSGDVTHHAFDAEIDHFVECVRQGRESHCNIADAYRSHELCFAIDRSIELGGRPVVLPLE